jgi:hypothetical protein
MMPQPHTIYFLKNAFPVGFSGEVYDSAELSGKFAPKGTSVVLAQILDNGLVILTLWEDSKRFVVMPVGVFGDHVTADIAEWKGAA